MIVNFRENRSVNTVKQIVVRAGGKTRLGTEKYFQTAFLAIRLGFLVIAEKLIQILIFGAVVILILKVVIFVLM